MFDVAFHSGALSSSKIGCLSDYVLIIAAVAHPELGQMLRSVHVRFPLMFSHSVADKVMIPFNSHSYLGPVRKVAVGT